LISSQGFESKG